MYCIALTFFKCHFLPRRISAEQHATNQNDFEKCYRIDVHLYKQLNGKFLTDSRILFAKKKCVPTSD